MGPRSLIVAWAQVTSLLVSLISLSTCLNDLFDGGTREEAGFLHLRWGLWPGPPLMTLHLAASEEPAGRHGPPKCACVRVCGGVSPRSLKREDLRSPLAVMGLWGPLAMFAFKKFSVYRPAVPADRGGGGIYLLPLL